MILKQKSLHYQTGEQSETATCESSQSENKFFSSLKSNYFSKKSMIFQGSQRSGLRQSTPGFFHSPSSSDVFLTKTSLHDSPTIATYEKRALTDSDIYLRTLMPYLHLNNKEKRLYYTPFKGEIDRNLVNHVNSQSLYLIREVPSTPGTSSNTKETFYQVQPNEEKIEQLREQIETGFNLYAKLLLYNRMRVEYSVEVNKLRHLLEKILPEIETESTFDYENNWKEILLSSNMDQESYEQHKAIFEPVIKEKFIPELTKLQKEFFAMDYLSGQYGELKNKFDCLVQDINRTIRFIGTLKKQSDVGNDFITLALRHQARFKQLKQPEELYQNYVDLMVKVRMLANESGSFLKLRDAFRKYLKLTAILEIYSKGEAKLKEMKRRLFVITNQLQKRAEAGQKVNLYDLFRRTKSDMPGSDLPVEDFDIDLKKLTEGEFLQKSMLVQMKKHLLSVEMFVRRAELFCEGLATERNQNKVSKMFDNASTYIEQVERTLRGITFAKQKMEEIKPIIEKVSIEEKTIESVEKEVLKDLKEVAFQLKQNDCTLNFESWSSTKIVSSLKKTLQLELLLKKWKKGDQKGIAMGRKEILGKLAKIIRNRTNERNKIYVTCKSRVDSSLTLRDVIDLFKSKKLWQAINSQRSHLVSIKDTSQDPKKPIHRKIYCNPELEASMFQIIRFFINTLADSPQKRLP